jgi:hypothetical protein
LTLPDAASVWQIMQMGLAALANCCEWHPAQGMCPGSRIFDESSSRRWQSRHGSRACCVFSWLNAEKSPVGSGRPKLVVAEGSGGAAIRDGAVDEHAPWPTRRRDRLRRGSFGEPSGSSPGPA